MLDRRSALVIVAPGAKADGWTKLVERFTDDVRAFPGVKDAFGAVMAAYVDHAQPRLAPTVRRCFESGARGVVVVPLVSTEAAQELEEIPGILGLDVPPHVRERLVAEGYDVLFPGMPIQLLTLPRKVETLIGNIHRRVAGGTPPTGREAIVLCAEGSTLHHEAHEALLSQVRRGLMELGYGFAGRAYVGLSVGRDPASALAAIVSAGGMAGIDRVYVVPLMLSQSELQFGPIADACVRAHAESGVEVFYASDALLPDAEWVSMVAHHALQAIGAYTSGSPRVLA